MTVIAVARKNGRITMAADSLVSIGSTTVLSGSPKLRKKDQTIIGASGTCGQDTLFADIVFKVIQQSNDWYKKWPDYCLSSEKNDAISKLNSKDNYILVVNQGKIYQVHADGVIFECGEDYMAIGSGYTYALGALHALWDKYKDTKILAERAVEAACKLNNACGPPVVSETLTIK